MMKSLNDPIINSRRRSELAFSDSRYYQSIVQSSDPIDEEKQIDSADLEQKSDEKVNDDLRNIVNIIHRPNTIVFPPIIRKVLPPLLDIGNFTLSIEPLPEELNQSSSQSNKWRSRSVNTADTLTSMNFLKIKLSELVEKVMDNRQMTIDIGEFSMKLESPLPLDITPTVLDEGLEHIGFVKKELLEYMEDLHAIKVVRIDEVFSGYDTSPIKAYLTSHRTAFIRLVDALSNEAEITSQAIENIIEALTEIRALPQGLTTSIEGIQAELKHNPNVGFTMSKRCRCYVKFNMSRSLPICPVVYEFLQSSTSFCRILNLRGYKFAEHEFICLVTFFVRYKLCGLIEQLFLDYCGLSDRDIHSLCTVMLPHCKTLKVLSLQGEHISTSGAISLAVSIWDGNLLQLSMLRLDDNDIKYDGIKLLCASLNRCRYLTSISISSNPIGDWGVYYILKTLLNRHRWIYSRFPKPSRIQCVSVDHPAIDIAATHTQLPWIYYPPRNLPFSVIQSSTKFSFIVIDDRDRLIMTTSSNNIDPSPRSMKMQVSPNRTSRLRWASDEVNGDDEYDDDDMVDDHEALMSVSSHYIGSIDSHSSRSPSVRLDNKYGKSDSNRGSSSKHVILHLFRTSKKAKPSSGDISRRRSTSAASGAIDDRRASSSSKLPLQDNNDDDVDDYNSRSDDMFSMSDEAPYSSLSDDEVDKEPKEDEDKPAQASALLQPNYLPFQSIIRSNVLNFKGIRRDAPSNRKKRLSKIQQLFIKIQYKLFAVIIFRQLMRPGLQVTSLNMSNCQLTPISSLLLRMALIDKSCITELNLSDNPLLCSSDDLNRMNLSSESKGSYDQKSVKKSATLQPLGDTSMQFYYILTLGRIRHLRLNRCGLNEENMEMLSQAMMKSKYLQSIQLSDNQLGPTALNWLTTALGQFSIDLLDMTSGYQPPVTLSKFSAEDFGGLLLDDDTLEKITSNMMKRARNDEDEGDNIEPMMKSLSFNRSGSPRNSRPTVKEQARAESKKSRKFYLELFGKRYVKQIAQRRKSKPSEQYNDEEEY